MPHVLKAAIITGQAKEEAVFTPRILIISKDMPSEFRDLQVPVKLNFAMSINKSQGQSLKVVGLNLISPCFSHGHLYVGCSRVGTNKSLFILTNLMAKQTMWFIPKLWNNLNNHHPKKNSEKAVGLCRYAI